MDAKFTDWKVRRTILGKARVGQPWDLPHTAYYVALLMGAREINLIGCGHGVPPGVEHFDAVAATDKATSLPFLFGAKQHRPLIEQTLALIEASRSAGVAVNSTKPSNT